MCRRAQSAKRQAPKQCVFSSAATAKVRKKLYTASFSAKFLRLNAFFLLIDDFPSSSMPQLFLLPAQGFPFSLLLTLYNGTGYGLPNAVQFILYGTGTLGRRRFHPINILCKEALRHAKTASYSGGIELRV